MRLLLRHHQGTSGDAEPLNALEKYLHADQMPTLVKVGLAHAQFETIHPFLDGNGRVGRMLIPLMLVSEGILERPWLYVSLHLKRHRSTYYELLQRVRTHGAWEDWMDFFLDGLSAVADSAVGKIRQLLHLFETDRQAVALTRGGSIYGRAALQMNVTVYEYLRQRPPILDGRTELHAEHVFEGTLEDTDAPFIRVTNNCGQPPPGYTYTVDVYALELVGPGPHDLVVDTCDSELLFSGQAFFPIDTVVMAYQDNDGSGHPLDLDDACPHLLTQADDGCSNYGGPSLLRMTGLREGTVQIAVTTFGGPPATPMPYVLHVWSDTSCE